MRTYMIFLITLAIPLSLFSIDFIGKTYEDHIWMGFDGERNTSGSQRISFGDDEVLYEIDDNSHKVKSVVYDEYKYKYKVIDNCGLTFIVLDSNTKWLAIYNEDILALYDDNDYPFFVGFNTEKNYSIYGIGIFPRNSGDYTASSFLVEEINGKLIKYSPDDITNLSNPTPWVEGVDGNGIGEKLYYRLKDESYMKLVQVSGELDYYSKWTFFISNGYVSYSRPDLYKGNNRIKEIRFTQPETNETYITNILDTPNIQKISFPDDAKMDGNIIIMEITDIYEGSKYQDTCVSFIIQYEEKERI